MSTAARISRVLGWLVLFLAPALGVFGYVYFLQAKPCEAPITYRTATFDTQFSLSRADFLDAIGQASTIWERSIGRDLFTYDPKGKLAINLVYDERQQDTQNRQEIDTKINQTESLYKAKRVALESLTAEYKSASSEYETSVVQFKEKADTYEAEVRAYNRRGGAPKAEYTRLTNEKNTLLSMQAALEPKRLTVNTLADQIRTLTGQVNALAKETNSNVDAYNSGIFVGKEFDAGLYTRDAEGERIAIYQFDNKAKLIRVLAHELGHALGLDHNSNPQSIMYELNQGDREKLSSDDLQALKTLCSLQPS